MSDPTREDIAQALYDHCEVFEHSDGTMTCAGCGDRIDGASPDTDHVSHQADQVLALIAPARRAARAEAWDEAYEQGIWDERTSESNIGITGMGGKVAPARRNPYRQEVDQ